MREILTELLQEVRAAGVPISVAESIDALRSAAAVGVERESLRDALAAAVVKDEADRDTFDEVFERFFAVGEGVRARRARRRSGGESGQERPGPGEDQGGTVRRPEPRPERPADRRQRAPEPRSAEATLRDGSRADLARRRRQQALVRKPFASLAGDEAEELVELAEHLARRFRTRLARRFRRDRRGRLDFRRTIRGSIAHGGAALRLELRRRRKARSDLLVLCDLSGSVRHAAELFTRIVAPCGDYFRRVRLFVYVDHPVAASVEAGRLVPHEPIDFHAFSDLGRVLVDLEAREASSFTRSTVLVVLGDARNNRRPARADVLARLRARIRTLWWLLPEPSARWATGDSAIEAYRPFCDELLECATPSQLLATLARLPW